RFKYKVATLKASQSKLKADIDAAKTHQATIEHDPETTVQALEATEIELEEQVQTKEWEIQGLQTQVALNCFAPLIPMHPVSKLPASLSISVERDEKAAVVVDLQLAMDELNESRLVLSDDVDRLCLEKQAKADGLKVTRDEFHAQFDELAAEVVKGKAVVDALTLE
ncbi:hypothetical protein DYB25_014043, partial [Aphanomyces astaci]